MRAGRDTAAALGRLPEFRARLRACEDVGELFARGAELACRECLFDRAVVLAVEPTQLTAGVSDLIRDEQSDRLRRIVLDTPILLVPGTEETERLNPATSGQASSGERRSVLAERLGLANHALGVIAPEGSPLGLLVVDRADSALDSLDHALADGLATVLAAALEHLVMRARLAELAAELRHLTVSADALLTEVRRAPVTLPTVHRGGAAFPLFGDVAPLQRGEIRDLLSEREAEIAALLVQGRSNREIAEHLMLSPETVKGHVARILRKLDATNRVEAVSRYLALTADS